MGKSSRWFLSFIGVKSSKSNSSKEKLPVVDDIKHHPDHKNEPPVTKKKPRERRRWSFGRSSAKDTAAVEDAIRRAEPHLHQSSFEMSESVSFEKEQSKHAIAVAAASAAAAEAAVAAAQAAAAVVRLTSTGGSFRGVGKLEEWAAVVIQTGFRGYLARRALRALKAVVRLQALFRGHLVRKQAALTLHCMHALVKVQARVRARRVRDSRALEHGLKHQHQPARPRKSLDGWDASTATLDDLQSKFDQRQIGVLKRERALAYAYAQQHQRRDADLEPEAQPWEWSWLERWMSAHPWESHPSTEDTRNPPDSSQVNDRSSESSAKVVEVDSARTKRKPRKRSGLSSESISFENSSAALNNSNNNNWSPVKPAEAYYGGASTKAMNHHHHHQGNIYSALTGGDFEDEDSFLSTAKSSPAFSTAGSRAVKANTFHSNRSEQADDVYYYEYGAHPSYMASTKSTTAKARSQSAPRQRPSTGQTDKHSSKRNSLSGLEMRQPSVSSKSQQLQRQVSPVRRNRAFTGPLSLDRSWMSLKDGGAECRRPFRP